MSKFVKLSFYNEDINPLEEAEYINIDAIQRIHFNGNKCFLYLHGQEKPLCVTNESEIHTLKSLVLSE